MRLESLSTPGGPLNIDAPQATVMDRRYFRSVGTEWVPTASRRKLHSELMETWNTRCQNPRRERKAILFAGPPAAGKSTLMGASNAYFGEYRRVDADDFKELLLQSVVNDGLLATLLPESLQDNVAERFHPLELSALVHRESTILQERALNEAMRAGENIAIDGTLGYLPWAEELVRQLRDFGYKIHVIDVEAVQELSLARVVGRWRTGYEKALACPQDPNAALGGRWLPASAVTRLFTTGLEVRGGSPIAHCSVTETHAREIATKFPEVVKYELHRTSDAAGAPTLEAQWQRTHSGEWVSQ